MPRKLLRGWLLACILACIKASPVRQGRTEFIYSIPENVDEQFAASGYGFEDSSPEKNVDQAEEASIELSKLNQASLATGRQKYVALGDGLEPDAEMLPAHYTGVRSPGVDHMEITMMDFVDKSLPETKVRKGSQSKTLFENISRAGDSRDNLKSTHSNAAERKKSRDETKMHLKEQKGKSMSAKDESYEIEDHQERDHNANDYHKDKYKKITDFYDSYHPRGR